MASVPSNLTAQQFQQGGAGSKQSGESAVGGGQMSPMRVRDLFDKGTRAIRQSAFDYWINRSYLAGNQWVTWSKSQQRVIELRRADDRTRVVMNKMAAYHRTIMAKLHTNPLAFDVIPTAADDAAMRGARIGEAILADAYREHRWEDIRIEADSSMFNGGTAGLCVEWDPKAGTTIGERDDGSRFGTGDVKITALSIVEMVTQPGARELETALWWIRNAALPPDEVKARYGLNKLPPADAGAAMGPMSLRLAGTDMTQSQVVNYLTQVLTYFERPYGDQKGQIVTVVAGAVVDQQPWPFPFTDRLNIVAQRETRVEQRWYGDTILTFLVPMQAAYNASWSNILEHMKLAGNARLFVNDASMDLIDELTDTPGEIVPYIGDHVPQWGAPPPMPQWWVEQPQMLRADMDDLVGLHNPNNPPTAVESGVGLTILAEHDDTPLATAAGESARAWGAVATMVLKLYEDKVTETRQAKLGGAPGRPPEMVRWSGKDLAGQTSARVPIDGILPKSHAAEENRAMHLAQAGVITDLKSYMAVSGAPDAASVEDEMDPDAAKAKRENHAMTVGNVCIPARFDNHGVHLNEVNRFRKSARYEQLQTQKLPPELKRELTKVWKVLKAAFQASADDDAPQIPESYADIVDLHATGHEVMAAEEAAKQQLLAVHAPALMGAAQANEAPGSATGPINQGQSMPTAPASVGGTQPAPPTATGPGPAPVAPSMPGLPPGGPASPAGGALSMPGASPTQ